MRTTIPAAKRALNELLKEWPALEGVHVRRGLPATEPSEKERVYIVGTEELTYRPGTEEGAVYETYVVVLLIEVHRHGRNKESLRDDVEDRAWEIFDEIGAALDDDEGELGGAVEMCALDGIRNEVTLPTDNGWISKITVLVRPTSLI